MELRTTFTVSEEKVSIDGTVQTVARITCCGRKTLLYKRDKLQFCCNCNYEYGLNGNETGIFGSGCKTPDEYSEKLFNEVL